jgi:hypothetical protein
MPAFNFTLNSAAQHKSTRDDADANNHGDDDDIGTNDDGEDDLRGSDESDDGGRISDSGDDEDATADDDDDAVSIDPQNNDWQNSTCSLPSRVGVTFRVGLLHNPAASNKL